MLKVLWTTELWFAVVCIRYCPSPLLVVPWSGLPRRAYLLVIKSTLPQRLAVGDPLRGDVEPGGLDTTGSHAADFLRSDDTAALEHLEVLNHRRKGDAEGLGQVADRRRPAAEVLDEPPPCRVAERMEDLVGRHLVKHLLKYTPPRRITKKR